VAVPVHVPDQKALVRELTRVNDRVRVGHAESLLQLLCARRAMGDEQARERAEELVVGRIRHQDRMHGGSFAQCPRPGVPLPPGRRRLEVAAASQTT